MVQLLSDNPASADTLGMSQTADLLAAVVTECKPPFTVGLFGEWGSGKTSLMQLVAERIRAGNRKTVWFNAWKYDGKEILWNALIQAIFHSMQLDPEIAEQETKSEFRERIQHAAISLAKYASKVAVRFVPGDLIKSEDVDTIWDMFGASHAGSAQYDFINRFEDTFDNLVKEYVGDDGKLTIFIDDLDRCLPENAIAVLESLKLYLDRANCVFVLAAEPSIIEEGIRLRYGSNPRLSARDYIEKIIQLPFMMPKIDQKNALSMISVNESLTELLSATFGQRLIEEATSYNPRRLKRFLNSLSILEALRKVITSEERLNLSKVLLIQMRFPHLYYELLKDARVLAQLDEILALTDAEQVTALEQSSEILRSLYSDPQLRQFLTATREIPSDRGSVEKWIQVISGDTQAA